MHEYLKPLWRRETQSLYKPISAFLREHYGYFLYFAHCLKSSNTPQTGASVKSVILEQKVGIQLDNILLEKSFYHH